MLVFVRDNNAYSFWSRLLAISPISAEGSVSSVHWPLSEFEAVLTSFRLRMMDEAMWRIS